jgi:hypothetical protein
MPTYSIPARIFAGVIAAAAWLGLGCYVVAEAATQNGDWLAALWVNASFLTDLTNLIVAIVMTGVALGVASLSRASVVGWAITAIATVGIGFWVIGGKLTSESALEDILLHGFTPVATMLFWFIAGAKQPLRWRSAAVWLIWPIAYFTYALGRGALTGTYAYGFLDFRTESPASVALMIGVIVAICAVAALIVIGVSKLRGVRA